MTMPEDVPVTSERELTAAEVDHFRETVLRPSIAWLRNGRDIFEAPSGSEFELKETVVVNFPVKIEVTARVTDAICDEDITLVREISVVTKFLDLELNESMVRTAIAGKAVEEDDEEVEQDLLNAWSITKYWIDDTDDPSRVDQWHELQGPDGDVYWSDDAMGLFGEEDVTRLSEDEENMFEQFEASMVQRVTEQHLDDIRVALSMLGVPEALLGYDDSSEEQIG
jgi:hypothetical protein